MEEVMKKRLILVMLLLAAVTLGLVAQPAGESATTWKVSEQSTEKTPKYVFMVTAQV
jgi:outer membrane biogenesis lipoprotein LolB